MPAAAHSIDDVHIDRELAGRGLYDFTELAFPIVEPDIQFMANWHIGAICEHLQAFREREIKNLIINIPPGAMKSLLCCVMYPAWAWTTEPGRRMIYGSFSGDVSKRDSLKTRQLVESLWYQERWGALAEGSEQVKDAPPRPWARVTPNQDQWEAKRFSNMKGGFRYGVTVGGQVLGFHGNDQFADDPVKPDPLDISDKNMLVAKGWWNGVMSTRKLPGCGRCIIMQRLHELDLAGVAIDSGDYETLVIPMEHDPSRVRSSTSLGFEDPRTEKGEHLWPERWPGGQARDGEVETLKRDLGPRQAAAQLDQDPAPAEGAIFKHSMVQYFLEPPSVRRFDRMLLSVDATFKKTLKGSFVVNQVWGQDQADVFLMDQIRARMSFSETIESIVRLAEKWPDLTTILIEDKANGPAIIDALQKILPGIIPAEPHGDKESRANAVEPMWAAGNVWLPDPSICDIDPETRQPWVVGFVKELTSFPVAAHDDQVDAMSQALAYLRRHSMVNFSKAMDALGSMMGGKRRRHNGR